MKHLKGILNQERHSFPLAIVVSQYNADITHALLKGALDYLESQGFNQEDITIVEVPGAIEIPIIVKHLAKHKQYDVIIALGAVVRGETSHYDYVCQQVSDGCQRIALESEIPVVFGVLTTESEEQAWDRLGGKHGHKGIEAAETALKIHAVIQELNRNLI